MAIIDGSISDTMVGSLSTVGSILKDASVSESLLYTESTLVGFDISVSIVDGIYAYEGIYGERNVSVSQFESIASSDSQVVNQILNVLIQDGLNMGVSLVFQGQKYEGWVLNANTYAASRYSGFNFNSFCQYQGRYYGCADDGVHSLDSSDDAGANIDAFISTGNIKPFGNSMARVFDAYLLVKNDGKMQVRVVSQGQIYTYPVETFSSFHKESRIKLGKGAKSVIWRFEIGNQNGADFDIESFKIYPIELTRHT